MRDVESLTKVNVDATLEALRDMFRHHAWATLELIDYCKRLAPDQLTATVGGTRGPILETLEHVVGADQRYQRRFGVKAEPAVNEGDGSSLELMRTAFAKQAEAWQAILGRLSEFDITIPAEPEDNWPEAKNARDLLLVQAIHHGNDHRTQICTILGSSGLTVPDLDVWMYWASQRIGR